MNPRRGPPPAGLFFFKADAEAGGGAVDEVEVGGDGRRVVNADV